MKLLHYRGGSLTPLIFSLLIFSIPQAGFAHHNPGHTGGPGGGGGPSGGGGGNKKSKLTMTKTLTPAGESGGIVDGLAQPGETLAYTITLTNSGKKDITTDVTETVPGNTTYAGGDDFDVPCNSGDIAGTDCTLTNIPVLGKSDTVLTFTVTVIAPNIDINNVVAATGVDCTASANDCSEITPADNPPSIAITSPIANAPVSDAGFTVSGTANDDSAITTVSVNDGTDDFDAPYNSVDGTWSVDLPGPYVSGDLSLIATATDNTSQATPSSTVTVKVPPTRTRHLLNRITYGITPTQLADINAGTFDSAAYLTDQLLFDADPTPLDCTEPSEAQDILDVSSPYAKNIELPIIEDDDLDEDTFNKLQTYTALMATYNECQLREIMTQFWSNHFHTQWSDIRNKYRNTSGATEEAAQIQATTWELQESDLFRLNALGNFRDLLGISAKSPAMLYYLDGVLNLAIAPNENYSREIQELHTLGVDNFTSNDVEEMARAFTGGTVDGSGNYTCDSSSHDHGEITIFLGTLQEATLGARTNDGTPATCEIATNWVLDRLTEHPFTANYICKELTTVLVSEQTTLPAYSNVVTACETAYATNSASDDQIAFMVQAMLAEAEIQFTQTSNYLNKVKTPLELAVGYLRTFEISDDSDLMEMEDETRYMGMELFQHHHPNGFFEEAFEWTNSELIIKRFRFISDMLFDSISPSNVYIDPLDFFTTKVKITDIQIVDYLLELALANQHTTLERDQALLALNPISETVFNALTDDAVKQTRLRIMLSIVLNFPAYQYQ